MQCGTVFNDARFCAIIRALDDSLRLSVIRRGISVDQARVLSEINHRVICQPADHTRRPDAVHASRSVLSASHSDHSSRVPKLLLERRSIDECTSIRIPRYRFQSVTH